MVKKLVLRQGDQQNRHEEVTLGTPAPPTPHSVCTRAWAASAGEPQRLAAARDSESLPARHVSASGGDHCRRRVGRLRRSRYLLWVFGLLEMGRCHPGMQCRLWRWFPSATRQERRIGVRRGIRHWLWDGRCPCRGRGIPLGHGPDHATGHAIGEPQGRGPRVRTEVLMRTLAALLVVLAFTLIAACESIVGIHDLSSDAGLSTGDSGSQCTLAPNSCAPGMSCVVPSDGTTSCATPGTAAAASSCMKDADCGPGLYCFVPFTQAQGMCPVVPGDAQGNDLCAGHALSPVLAGLYHRQLGRLRILRDWVHSRPDSAPTGSTALRSPRGALKRPIAVPPVRVRWAPSARRIPTARRAIFASASPPASSVASGVRCPRSPRHAETGSQCFPAYPAVVMGGKHLRLVLDSGCTLAPNSRLAGLGCYVRSRLQAAASRPIAEGVGGGNERVELYDQRGLRRGPGLRGSCAQVCRPWCQPGGAPCAVGNCVAIDPPLVLNAIPYGFCQ